jgi:hypothetical protein
MPDNQPSTPDSAGVDRTQTGAIADQKQTTTPAATTPQTSTTPDSPPTDDKSLLGTAGEKSLLNQKQPDDKATPAGAPETYAAFTVPDGYVLDEAVAGEAGKMFKEMNLSQEQGQKLVDFYVAKTNEAVTQPYEVWRDTQQKWVKEVKTDPFLGPRLDQVTTTISKAIDQVSASNPKLANTFREAMDYTGAGNHPAFIRMFYELASMITEGGPVAGKGPSPAGQTQRGDVPSAAKAMYPNLP